MSTLKIKLISDIKESCEEIKNLRKYQDENFYPRIPITMTFPSGNIYRFDLINFSYTRRCLMFNQYEKFLLRFGIFMALIGFIPLVTRSLLAYYMCLSLLGIVLFTMTTMKLYRLNFLKYIEFNDGGDNWWKNGNDDPEFFPPKWPSPKTKFQKLNIHPKTNPRALSRK